MTAARNEGEYLRLLLQRDGRRRRVDSEALCADRGRRAGYGRRLSRSTPIQWCPRADGPERARCAAPRDELLPDLIILDYRLPDLHGRELCRQLRANPETAGADPGGDRLAAGQPGLRLPRCRADEALPAAHAPGSFTPAAPPRDARRLDAAGCAPRVTDRVQSHVMVVEDDRDTREVVKLILEMEGMGVTEAADGFEALERLHELREHDPHRPCAIVLDIMMPRCSGEEFRSRQLDDPLIANVPIIVLSAVADQLRVDDCRRSPRWPSPSIPIFWCTSSAGRAVRWPKPDGGGKCLL